MPLGNEQQQMGHRHAHQKHRRLSVVGRVVVGTCGRALKGRWGQGGWQGLGRPGVTLGLAGKGAGRARLGQGGAGATGQVKGRLGRGLLLAGAWLGLGAGMQKAGELAQTQPCPAWPGGMLGAA